MHTSAPLYTNWGKANDFSDEASPLLELRGVPSVCDKLPTNAESKREGSAWLTLHGGDGGDHCATGHDRTVHLHPLSRGWGGRLPGPHLTGLQVGKLGEENWLSNDHHAKKEVINSSKLMFRLSVLSCIKHEPGKSKMLNGNFANILGNVNVK